MGAGIAFAGDEGVVGQGVVGDDPVSVGCVGLGGRDGVGAEGVEGREEGVEGVGGGVV